MSSHPHRPHGAGRRHLRLVVGDREGVAEGVPIAVRPDPQMNDGYRPRAVLHIVAPPDWRVTPSAHSWCSCGRERTAIGRAAVLSLVAAHNEHRATCPQLARAKEGGKAV
ncbi:hypothetical protein OHO83_17445 [Streptomyces sp. NBC_00569]|uniref:hypothetical protein n=1 Tax=unclassified Streptomyces TaxID=2593676 RepID=UPI0022552BFF|nr:MULTISPECIES: hypothetical protein [unclassified Streptomyces]MCX5439606.1 hypothetical protein [Streptomyces sp. NBC_00063]WUB93948.1 hypothetical protein OHO83_17445 [Streptomyces sp. NBC_00569]